MGGVGINEFLLIPRAVGLNGGSRDKRGVGPNGRGVYAVPRPILYHPALQGIVRRIGWSRTVLELNDGSRVLIPGPPGPHRRHDSGGSGFKTQQGAAFWWQGGI